jgi:hypothetical protein
MLATRMSKATTPGLTDKQAITDVVQSWALYRDTGDWDGLRSTVHPDAIMTATWFEGLFEAFIEAAQASWRRGSRSQHFLGGTVVEIRGERAIAQTRMAIMVRGMLGGTEVDVNCVGRFYDRVERRDGEWRIARRAVVYEKDRMDPVNPDLKLNLDAALLARFPDGYRHLAYLQSSAGAAVNPNLATAKGEALDKLIAAAHSWLAQA